ncbi:hypothetical protein ACHHYP_02398, partial [Achlya hypogyna]
MTFSRRQRLEAVAGVAYVCVTLVGCVAYLSILSESFGNDLWWPHHNTTGYDAFLIDVVNQALTSQGKGGFDLLAPEAMIAKAYTAPSSATTIYPPYIHHVVYTHFTSPAVVIPYLRQLSAYWSMRINVVYCWVDFNRTFEIAFSLGRQNRCRERYANDGGVYMEAVLRNQQWKAYTDMWSTDGNYFNVGIQQALEESVVGRAVLASIASGAATTTVADEVEYWHAHDIRRFEMLWQNRWLTAIAETITLSNAIGMRQELTIKSQRLLAGSWSSQPMSWMPIQQNFNAMILNRSLVRGSSRYYGGNVSGLPAISWETYRGLVDVNGNLRGQMAVLHEHVGPYFNIDTRFVPVLPALAVAYAGFHRALFDALEASPTALRQFAALSTVSLAPVPAAWVGYDYYGGNPMCQLGSATPFIQESFNFFDDCSQPTRLTADVSPTALLFAAVAMNASKSSLTSLCALDSATGDCRLAVATATAFLTSLELSTLDLESAVDAAAAAIKASNVGFMQFGFRNGSYTLLRQPLLEVNNTAWSALGWCFLVEWAQGTREVMAFEGDVATLVLISSAYSGQAYVTSDRPMPDATAAIYYAVVVTTVLLGTVGVFTVIYAFHINYHVTGRNLFFFNRIVGSVWIGRPILVLRGLSALFILSTSQLALVSTHGSARFVFAPRPWWATTLIAGEATWLTYVINDLLFLFWPTTTRFYAPLSSILTWLVLIVVEFSSPVNATLALDRQCRAVDMDAGVVCSSGLLEVGSPSRLLLLLGLQLFTVGVAIAVGYLYTINRVTNVQDTCLLLSGIGAAMLTPVQPDSNNYDAVSCVLCGLVPFSYRKRRLVFHLTLWIFLRDAITKTHCNLSRVSCVGLATRSVHVGPPTSPHIGPYLPRQVERLHGAKDLKAVIGCMFMVCAIGGSISYFEVAKENLANDFFWAGFNVTGAHAFFATWLNEQLLLGMKTATLDASGPSVSLLRAFREPAASVASVSTYGTIFQQKELNT